MEELIKKVKELAYSEFERTQMPIKIHIDLALDKGIDLAKKMGANIEIITLGTLLMDIQIGQALLEGRVPDHIKMSLDKTNEILSGFEIDEGIKENIRHCVLEHHGVDKFYSIESEICCNADCYRFASIRGLTIALRYLREMEFNDLINLVESKFNEKRKALTLEICKEELKPQIEILEKYINYLKHE